MSDGGRRWLEVSVRSPCAGDLAPLLADGLLALGGRAAEERDGWYVTYLEAPPDLDAFLEGSLSTLRAVTGLDEIDLQIAWRQHEEWAETWKRGLGARVITDRILVRPSWIVTPDAAGRDVVIVLDPGMAFGTAEHGTTRGCLRLLDRAVSVGDRVLDVGAGSGILAIAAALLGASDVVALEGDPFACEALRANLESNGVADRVCLVQGWVDSTGLVEHGPVAGVVANIETGILTQLIPGFRGALRPEGWLILSGILSEEWSRMKDAVEHGGFRLLDLDSDGEWRAGLFTYAETGC